MNIQTLSFAYKVKFGLEEGFRTDRRNNTLSINVEYFVVIYTMKTKPK